MYTGTRPGLTPAIRAEKGWRGRRELAPRRSATQIRCMHRRRVWRDTRRTQGPNHHHHHSPLPPPSHHHHHHRGRRLGGRAGWLYRVGHGDEVEHCAQYFVNSFLSPVLLFRRRLKSVADVLKGIGSKGVTQSRWDALLRYWGVVCRHGPCGPLSSLHPWDGGIPPDLHGFYK